MNEIGPEENDENGKGDAKGKQERCDWKNGRKEYTEESDWKKWTG
jgi:hypothetical protein